MSEPKVEYTVIIKKTVKDVPYVSQDWRKLVDEPDEKHKDIYGYVDTESIKDENTDIFEQTVTELDVQAVIKAVNDL